MSKDEIDSYDPRDSIPLVNDDGSVDVPAEDYEVDIIEARRKFMASTILSPPLSNIIGSLSTVAKIDPYAPGDYELRTLALDYSSRSAYSGPTDMVVLACLYVDYLRDGSVTPKVLEALRIERRKPETPLSR